MKLKQSNTKNSDLSKCPSILMRINSMEGWRLCTLASFSLFAFCPCVPTSHMNLKSQREILSLSLFLIVLEGDLRSIGSSSNIRAFLFFPFPPFATSVFPSAFSSGAPFRIFSISGFVLFDSFFSFFFSVPPTKTEVAPRVVDSPFKPIVALPTPDFISSSPQPLRFDRISDEILFRVSVPSSYCYAITCKHVT